MIIISQLTIGGLVQRKPRGKNVRDIHLVDLTPYLIGVDGGMPKSRRLLKAIVKRKGNIQLSQIWDIGGMGYGKTTRQMGLAEYLVCACPLYSGLKSQVIISNDIAAAMGAVEEGVEFLVIIINDVHKHHGSTGGIGKEKLMRVDLLFEGRHHVEEKTGVDYTFILFFVNGQEEKSILDWMKKNIKLEGSVMPGDNDNAIEWQEKHLGPFGMRMLEENNRLIDDQQKDEYKSRMVVYLPGRSTKYLGEADLMDPNRTSVGYVNFPIPTLVCDECGYKSCDEAEDEEAHPFFSSCPVCEGQESHYLIEEMGTIVPELSIIERQKDIIKRAEGIALSLVEDLGADGSPEATWMEYLYENDLDNWWFFVDNSWARKRLKEAYNRRSREVAEEKAAEAREFLSGKADLLDILVDRFIHVAREGKDLKAQFQAWLYDEAEEIWEALSAAPEDLDSLLEEVKLKLGREKLVRSEDDMARMKFLSTKILEAFEMAKLVMFELDLQPKGGKLVAIYQEVCRREAEGEKRDWVPEILDEARFGLIKQVGAKLDHAWYITKAGGGVVPSAAHTPVGEVGTDTSFGNYLKENIGEIVKGLKLQPWHEAVFRHSQKGVQLFGGDQMTQEEIRQMVSADFGKDLEGTSRISQVVGTVKGKVMRAIGLQYEAFLAIQDEKRYFWAYTSLRGKKSNEGLPDRMYLEDDILHIVSVKASTQNRPVAFGIHDLAPEYLLALWLMSTDKGLLEAVSTDENLVRGDFAREGARRGAYDPEAIVKEIGAIPDYEDVVLEVAYYNTHNDYEQTREIKVEREPVKYQYSPYTGDSGVLSFLPKEGVRGRGKARK